jgi:hypothetical protein
MSQAAGSELPAENAVVPGVPQSFALSHVSTRPAQRRLENRPTSRVPSTCVRLGLVQVPYVHPAGRSSMACEHRPSTCTNMLRALHHRAGTDFASYLDALKETHRRKTTFLAELAHGSQPPRQTRSG